MDCVVLGSWYSYDQDGDNVNEVGNDENKGLWVNPSVVCVVLGYSDSEDRQLSFSSAL